MEKNSLFLRAALSALSVAMMAGCTAYVAVCALGFAVPWAPVYLSALAVAALVRACARSTVASIGAAAGILVLAGALIALNSGALGALITAIPQLGRDAAAAETLLPAARTLALLAAILLSLLFSTLIRRPAGAPLAILILISAVICSMALNENVPLIAAVPGLIAAIAAFGMLADARADGLRPALLTTAAVAVVLALVLVPAGRATWSPLASLAERIRAVFEDYMQFTEERIAYSINEQGYDHAGLIDNNVVAMLGGPASPNEGEVMRVETDKSILLRGAIKRSYTGYSWIDDQAKARYLYYDFTHRSVRSAVFGFSKLADAGDALRATDVRVEMLADGTSTLFVPAGMSGFTMDLSDAVYYNSTGEMFLTRTVTAGDSYALTAQLPLSDQALIEAARTAELKQDDEAPRMRDEYMALPSGIDPAVYALAVEITQESGTDCEKALAIEDYLARNYAYTLDGGYPEAGRDFVSYFLLDAREGYCSYFASAMAVMCRIAGVPARYVEGYSVKADASGVSLVTGEDAHAWVEVYLNGLGWTAFDPTARSREASGGDGSSTEASGDAGGGMDDRAGTEAGRETPFEDDSQPNDGGDSTPSPTPDVGSDGDAQTPTPDPNAGTDGASPSPSPDAGTDGASPSPSPDAGSDGASPTPDPDAGSDESPSPSPNPDDAPYAGGENPQAGDADAGADQNRGHAWLWVLLGLLLALLIAGAVFLFKRRLAATDPLQMVKKTRSAQTAAMILYRALLTLLAQLGLSPLSGETPEQFAGRVQQAIPNADYAVFVSDVAQSRYSGKPLGKPTIDAGRRAYTAFLSGMKRTERFRYALRRATRGIGSIEIIP